MLCHIVTFKWHWNISFVLKNKGETIKIRISLLFYSCIKGNKWYVTVKCTLYFTGTYRRMPHHCLHCQTITLHHQNTTGRLYKYTLMTHNYLYITSDGSEVQAPTRLQKVLYLLKQWFKVQMDFCETGSRRLYKQTVVKMTYIWLKWYWFKVLIATRIPTKYYRKPSVRNDRTSREGCWTFSFSFSKAFWANEPLTDLDWICSTLIGGVLPVFSSWCI